MKRKFRIAAMAALVVNLLFLAGCAGQVPNGVMFPVSQTPASNSSNPAVTSVAPPATPGVGSSTAAATTVAVGSSVMIDVESGSTTQTIAPNQTAFVPEESNYIYVLVHFPYPASSTNFETIQTMRAAVIQPSTMSWQVEMKNPPTADALAFGLRGAGSGSMTIQISGALSIPPVRFNIQVGNGMPTPTQTLDFQTITMDDAGQTIVLHVGDRFLLDLGAGYDWTITIDNPAVISRVADITVVQGAQGVYEALSPGDAALTATGDPLCRQTQPPCGAPSRSFQIQIVVQ